MTQRLATLTLSLLWKVETALVIVSITVICVLLAADIILRVFIQTSLHGAQRIAVFLMILNGFLGIALATACGRRPQVLGKIERWHQTMKN